MTTLGRIEFDIKDGNFSWKDVGLKLALVLYHVRSPLKEQSYHGSRLSIGRAIGRASKYCICISRE
jgi:hypothetical protein